MRATRRLLPLLLLLLLLLLLKEHLKHLPAPRQQGTEGRTDHRIAPKQHGTEGRTDPRIAQNRIEKVPNVTSETLLEMKS